MHGENRSNLSQTGLYAVFDSIAAKQKKDLLARAERGIISYTDMGQMIDIMAKDRDYLSKHPYEIWHDDKRGYWMTWLPNDRTKTGRKQMKCKSKEGLVSKIIAYYKGQVSQPTISEICRQALDNDISRRDIRESSYTKYSNLCKSHLQMDLPFCKDPISKITTDKLESYIRQVIVQHALTMTGWRDLRIVIIKGLKYAVSQKYLDMDVDKFFRNIQLSRSLFRPARQHTARTETYSDDEAKRLISYLYTHDDVVENLGIILLFQSGLRIGELSTLRWANVKDGSILVENTEVTYRSRETGLYVVEEGDAPKSEAGRREVFLPQTAAGTIRCIRRLNPSGTYVFAKNGQRIKTKSFRYRLNVACKAIGIEYRPPHKIRKTYSCNLFEHHVETDAVAVQLGHSDIQTTNKYYRVWRESREAAKQMISNAVKY